MRTEEATRVDRPIHVIGCRGCGSTIAESFLALANIPFDREEVDYDAQGSARDRLQALNPLIQIPTLVLPDGSVLTETLAVAAFVHARAPDVGLIPASATLQIPFWRWVTVLVAAVYPTFTYGDSPNKWVQNVEGQAQLRESTDERRKLLWRAIEGECKAPYFLGDTFSAIDVYLAVMSHWRPGLPWFQENTPKLAAVSARVGAMAALRDILSANFE